MGGARAEKASPCASEEMNEGGTARPLLNAAPMAEMGQNGLRRCLDQRAAETPEVAASFSSVAAE